MSLDHDIALSLDGGIMSNPTCETCRFFVRENDYRHTGSCKRRSPILFPVLKVGGSYCSDENNGRFPEMRKSDFCGDHEEKKV